MSVKLKFIELAILEMKGLKKRAPAPEELNKYFRQCGGPWKTTDSNTSWCGIFACYLLRQAGARVKWIMNKGINPEVGENNPEGRIYAQLIGGNEGMTMGDIAIRGTHHFIVMGSSDKAGNIECVEGNYGGLQYPMLHYGINPKNHLSNVHHYYKIF